ncbi:hypothetical protein CQ14_29530 [Bradyrhizobium lablabi]|uniref:Uncharacterized protein n=1 Tax=Bradyrhizobium lablabi TaxID=722472 RepID=A0A0R3ML32_9BRAD|nr:hypothetical protein [Bradyrhizobium lablabi]KRR20270.1 hypothetical protein CQ14_29530 [Bradyrhizobium lablabi]
MRLGPTIAGKIGCTLQTLHDLVKKADIDNRQRAGGSTDMTEKLKPVTAAHELVGEKLHAKIG